MKQSKFNVGTNVIAKWADQIERPSRIRAKLFENNSWNYLVYTLDGSDHCILHERRLVRESDMK